MASKWTQIITPHITKIAASEARSAVKPVTDELDKSLKGTMNRSGKNMMKAGAVATAGITAPVVAFLKTGAEGLARIETLGAQTDSVLKSTGNAANVTRKEIDDLAGSIEKKTGIEAESITEGQNLLLTFKNIRNEAGKGNDIFNQSTTALVDMAKAMGTEPRAAAIQLGKALNDPVKGISALSRVGITFTKDQEEMIKKLVEGGKTMDAQKIILGELNSQFGGSAEAYGKTFAGQAEIAAHSWGELQEAMAANIMPAILKIVQAVSKGLEKFNSLSPGTKKIITYFGLGLAVLGPLLIVIGSIVTAISAIAPAVAVVGGAFAFLVSPVALVIIGIVALVAAIVIAYKKSETFRNIVQAAWTMIKTVVIGAINGIVAYFKMWLNVYKTVWAGVKAVVMAVVNAVIAYFKMWLNVYKTVWAGVKAVVMAVVNAVIGYFKMWIAAYKMVWNGIKTGATTAINFLKSIPGKIKSVFNSAKDWLKDAGRNIIKGLVDGIKSVASLPKEALGGVMGGMRNLLPFSPAKEGPFSGRGWTTYSGKSIVQGLQIGINDQEPKAVKAMNSTMQALKNATSTPVNGAENANSKPAGNFTQIIQTPAPQSLGDIQRAARRGALLGGAI